MARDSPINFKPINSSLHTESDFQTIIQAVEAKLREEENKFNSSSSKTQPSSPSSITYDFRGANIGNVAHHVQGNQQTSQLHSQTNADTTHQEYQT